MERFLYLVLDLGALIVPLLFSFHPRIRFDKQWRAYWPACITVAALFIAWDSAFTSIGVWGFNERYLLGPRILGLPIEEVLFFICIPYACVFTYHVFGTFKDDPWNARIGRWVTWGLVVLLAVVGVWNVDRWYTVTTCAGLALALAALGRSGARFIGRFLVTYAVILVPFFLINGILTGSFIQDEVVWYNDAENLGIRLGTIPVEDVFYGMLLILLNVVLFERWRRAAQ